MTVTIGPPLSTLIAVAGACGLGVTAGMVVKKVNRLISRWRIRAWVAQVFKPKEAGS